MNTILGHQGKCEFVFKPGECSMTKIFLIIFFVKENQYIYRLIYLCYESRVLFWLKIGHPGEGEGGGFCIIEDSRIQINATTITNVKWFLFVYAPLLLVSTTGCGHFKFY